MRCPDPVQLEALVDGELPADRAAGVTRHLEECPACATQVRRIRQLVALLRQRSVPVLDELEVAQLVESVRRKAEVKRRLTFAAWRRSLVAASLVLALGTGALTWYRLNSPGRRPVAPDAFALALLHEHRRYEVALGAAADLGFNVQVAVLGQ
ncbi:MAG: zf-HC2 domain-containing protein [Bacillota bacterium]|nr:zf-HC2 domain-containing protein [Bacillota bacterium]